jgi:aminopeptidase N
VASGAVGNLTPAALGKTISIETANTLRVFQNYFGPYPYKQLVVTNIIGSYGQGWPGLLYLGWFTFLDSTQRNELGIRNQIGLTDFFRGHESSHQWWGHRVGWKSYHDQWLSEGFAEFSGKLYVQFRRDPKEFLTQLRKDKELLQAGDINRHQIDSLGPIWMGRRIRSSETGPGSYQDLIYSKGGYVLQMLREQLVDPRSQDTDHLFKDMMQDYCKTFDNKPASTEDFKSIVEKHMIRGMDLDGNHKMDWFFNQYVYGTGIPHYVFRASVEPTPDGKTHIKGELTRTGVPDNWKDVVPLYAHMGDKTMRLGTLSVTRPTETVDATVPAKIDRISINDHEDLLADVKQ